MALSKEVKQEIIAKYGKDAAPYIGEYVKSMKEAVAEV